MKTIIRTLAATVILAVVASAHADSPYDYRGAMQPGYDAQQYSGYRPHPLAGLREINLRQNEQRARIKMGFHRGTFTRWEFRRLMAEQHDIQAQERAFVSDGFLAPRERLELNRRLDIASQHIFIEAHDRQRRF